MRDLGAVTLAVMARAPIPGFAKTRLIPRLGARGAAELHAMLLARTLRVAAASGYDAVTVWCTPSARAPGFAALRNAGLAWRDQPVGDLGARMLAAVVAAAGPVVVIGTDCPQLDTGHLSDARAALAGGADVVLLPAEDGGYAAIGLARAEASLFEGVPWGTAEVLGATRARIARLGWARHELAPVRDVDLPADVDWLLACEVLGPEERARVAIHLGEAQPSVEAGFTRTKHGGHG